MGNLHVIQIIHVPLAELWTVGPSGLLAVKLRRELAKK